MLCSIIIIIEISGIYIVFILQIDYRIEKAEVKFYKYPSSIGADNDPLGWKISFSDVNKKGQSSIALFILSGGGTRTPHTTDMSRVL